MDFQLGPASPVTQEFSTAKRAYFVSRGAGLSGYVAECGAAIIGAMTGLRPDHLENHAAYIADWLVLVRSDPRAFLSAAAKAQSAVDWLIARAGDPVNEPAPAISADHKAALHT
ncbi:MAG: antirestriction protein ArdC [Hyphomonadaceae bacterium]|nr:antirestriction protein ArdC [Hyphomonadaceae bacterium]